MAPKKKAAVKPSAAEESTQPSVDESVASTPLTPSVAASPPAKGRKSASVAPATPSESAAPPAPVSADPSPSPGGRRRKPEAATAVATTTADDVAAATSPKPRKDKAPPAFVDVLVADNVAPAALGIVDMALSRDENLVAAARSNGSLAVYRVLPGPDPEKPIFNFVMTANTGGHTNCGIIRVSFLGESDEFIVATLWSGQIALYHAVSLAVISVSARVGGVIRSIARSGPRDFFGACADGSARRYQLTPANDGIQVVLTLPKNVSCERALSVAVDVALGLVVVGDDARTVTAFELGAVGAKHLSQRWHMQLPNGYPMAIAMSAAGNAIAIGTSLNEVLFVDPSIGLVVNTFQHHKGPVTVLIEAAGVFYASGWHESLRAYRSASATSKNGAKPTPATRANAKASAADYCPAEVKRRTHYHECVALAVGIKTDLFLSAARDGTIMFTNLPKLFTHPASYLDSQVSKTPYELCGSGHLLFTHREAVVQVFRVLPTQLLPLASISLSGEFNVRGLWPNEDGTRLCVATDDRLLVLAVDANLETNTCVIRRLVQEPIGEIASACFVSKDVCCASVGSQILVIACADESVTAVADATKRLHNMRRKQAVQHRRGNAEALAEVAYQTTSVKQVYTSPRIQGYIHSMAEANVPMQQCIFVATSAPAAYHFIRFDRTEPYKLVDPPSCEATDCVAVRKMQAAGEVAFLCPTDGRHWVAKAPLVTNRVAELVTKKPTSLTVARALLPQNAVALGRYPENPTMCAAAFPGGIVQFQANGERWSYIRQADRAKADAHNIKTKTEFAAFVPSNSAAVPPWAAQLDTKGHLGLVRKAHRAEAATIALAGEDSDAEGSDDGRGEDPAQLAEGVTKGAKRSDAVFVLRRNVDGLLDGLPNMWRVRRFGN